MILLGELKGTTHKLELLNSVNNGSGFNQNELISTNFLTELGIIVYVLLIIMEPAPSTRMVFKTFNLLVILEHQHLLSSCSKNWSKI